MAEEENHKQNENAPKAPISELYPTAYKGALRADPTVQATHKKRWWQVFKKSEPDSFASLGVMVLGFIVFCMICIAIALSAI